MIVYNMDTFCAVIQRTFSDYSRHLCGLSFKITGACPIIHARSAGRTAYSQSCSLSSS